MDFSDTPEEAAFRVEARAFLDAHMPLKVPGRVHVSRAMTPEDVAASKAWQRLKAENGFAGILWPKQYGGREGTMMQQIIFGQEEERYAVPTTVFNQGVGMAMPTVMRFGTPEQLARYPRPALFGEEVWCQLFSEPAAGSDLAGLRTRAVRDGEDWVIDGQKIWTSYAHFADFGMLVARSDPEAAKHAGLTFFVVDMRTPGIEIRPIKQISGMSNFSEVFFDGVRIPDSQRLGGVGEGWKVALTMLANERFTVGRAEGPDFDEIFALARSVGMVDDSAVRERLAEWYVRSAGIKYTRLRSQTALSRGKAPGPENSILKLVSATKLQEIATFGIDLAGMAGTVTDPEIAAMHAMFQQALLYAPSKRIAGGTDEILRNIIAERVLGLPGDVRADKGLPFNRIPTGAR
ncbi:MAG: acyl-CoA dehydrogenase family protein [Novosphingobium sp.]|nr:acyl-CoA dehydrogenase family protein [Novosphingobium sp.]